MNLINLMSLMNLNMIYMPDESGDELNEPDYEPDNENNKS